MMLYHVSIRFGTGAPDVVPVQANTAAKAIAQALRGTNIESQVNAGACYHVFVELAPLADRMKDGAS